MVEASGLVTSMGSQYNVLGWFKKPVSDSISSNVMFERTYFLTYRTPYLNWNCTFPLSSFVHNLPLSSHPANYHVVAISRSNLGIKENVSLCPFRAKWQVLLKYHPPPNWYLSSPHFPAALYASSAETNPYISLIGSILGGRREGQVLLQI